jgi:hypothetical protein
MTIVLLASCSLSNLATPRSLTTPSVGPSFYCSTQCNGTFRLRDRSATIAQFERDRCAVIAAPVSLRSEKSNTARLQERLGDRGRATANQRIGGSG